MPAGVPFRKTHSLEELGAACLALGATLEQLAGKVFSLKDNTVWLPATRPIIEALLHARYFLEMAFR